MALAMKEIQWEKPIIPPSTPDPAFAKDVMEVLGLSSVPDAYRMTSSSPWIRLLQLDLHRCPVVATPERLVALAHLVTSQESACRFCWGAARAGMRMLGYDERFIEEVETDAKLADATDRDVIRFCRSLAKSNPRPARQDALALKKVGFSDLACVELAFHVAGTCFHNRVATLLAAPLLDELEKLPDSFIGRLMRPLFARRMRKPPNPPSYPVPHEGEPFSAVTILLGEAPGATIFHHGLVGAFASPVLPTRTKAMMFAIVARFLSCRLCEAESLKLMTDLGLSEAVCDEILRTLSSSALDERERQLVPWVRETVRIDQPGPVQRRTRALVDELGPEIMLEAIGIAALANATVRVAMLAE